MNTFVAFLHHLCAFSIVSVLIAELVLLQEPLSLSSVRKIVRIDGIYGASALAIIGLGAWRVMALEKGADYYLHSAPFITKLVIFGVVGLASIYPTLLFLKWRPASKLGVLPSVSATQLTRVRSVIRFQLAGIAIMLLMAAMTAKGISF